MRDLRSVQSPLLVGRDELLQLAERRIQEVAAGRGHLLLVAGEAGVGKTRLLGAIRRRAVADGFRDSAGDLAPYDRQVPLASILDLARTMTQVDAFGSLGRELLVLQRGQGADALGHRRVLVHEIADRIVAAIDRPTLLAFDDLQWADELSLEVIGELARRGRERPLLLVAGYRLGELPPGSIQREWRSRLLSQRFAEEVRLRPLTRDETALVTTLILGTGMPAPRDVVQAVWERTDGIPLHIEELLAALDEQARGDGRAIREAHVPDTIEDAVLARYGRLSPDARAVARAGAVIGRCFVPEVVAGLLDRPVNELDGPLGELVEESFLYPFNFLDRGYYDFRHQLLRDALYGTVQAAELRRLHARAGEFGGLIDGSSEIHASVHFERAGLRAQAYRAAVAGAQAASAVSSRHEAFELFARAVANLPDGLTAVERADLYESYCDAAFAVDDVPVAEETCRLARHWNLEAGRALEAAMDLLNLAGVYRRDVRPGAHRRALIAQAGTEIAALPEGPETWLAMSDVRLFEGIVELDRANLEAADVLFEEARELRRRSGSDDTSDIDFTAATSDVIAGRGSDGIEEMLRIAREARGARVEGTGVTAFRWAAATALRVLDYPTARIGLTEGLRYADEIEQSYCRHVLAATSAHVAWTEGRWDDAVGIASIELVERGSRRGTLGSRDALGLVALGRGELDRARSLFEASLEIGRPTEEVDLVLPATWGLAETALLAGDPTGAMRHCEDAVALALAGDERSLLVPFVVTGVRASLAARRPDVAEDWLARMRDLLAAWTIIAAPAIDHGEGLVRTSAGSTVAARHALERAVRGWDELGRTWEGLWARLDLAACLLRSNRDAEAVSAIRDVAGRADALGSAPLRDRAEELEVVARSRGAEEEPWRPLTAREFEVARLVSGGLTNAAIGEALGLSPRTVGAHIEHILAKLGFTRRAEIAAWVASMGTAATATG
ncbi:MAG TPA: AAA family ATPase [Candidatus Limnocylindrales bacterium]|nr:AAA family ATPase [Candidatus Limnocylindrales bacterium]